MNDEQNINEDLRTILDRIAVIEKRLDALEEGQVSDHKVKFRLENLEARMHAMEEWHRN